MYYARYIDLDDDMLRIAVSTEHPTSSAIYGEQRTRWASYQKAYHYEYMSASSPSPTTPTGTNRQREPQWFAPYVSGMIEVHDFEVWLDHLARCWQRKRFSLRGPDESAQEKTFRETLCRGYETLFKSKQTEYHDMLRGEVTKSRAALNRATGGDRMQALIRLRWVEKFHDAATAQVRGDRNFEIFARVPSGRGQYYDELTHEQRREFWKDPSRFGPKVARRWLHFVEPEVNLTASFRNSANFWTLTEIRWFAAADTVWRFALMAALERRRLQKFCRVDFLLSNWSLKEDVWQEQLARCWRRKRAVGCS